MNRGNHSSAAFRNKIDFSVNNNGTYYYSAIRFDQYGGLETKQVIADPAAPYAATDRYFKLTNDTASASGTLVTANNGNTWLNADGGKDLWLNWYSLNSPTSKADLRVADGNGGSAILSVIGSSRRVGINNLSPSYDLDVAGDTRTTGRLRVATSGGLLHIGDSSGGDASGAAQIYYHETSKSLRFYALNSNGGTIGVNQYQRYNGSSYENVWDSGNDGSGSGLDADLLDGYQLSGATSVGTKIFNNKGQNHTTNTDFNTVMSPGPNYLQQGTNGPTGTTSHQWYGFMFGLGADYGTSAGTSGNYGSQMYYPREDYSSAPYLYFRDLEDGTWQSWRKVYAGYADTAGDADTLDGQQGTYYRQSFSTLDAATRTNYNLAFKPASGNYAGLTFTTQAGLGAGYLLVRSDTSNDIYAANGITLVTDQGALTLANRTTSSGIRFMTGSPASTKLELTTTGVLQHTIPGNLTDGTYYSGYTMNITGASTFGGMRFDRNGTAKFRVGLRDDDLFQIANFNLSSGADQQFLISANGHVLIGTTEDRGMQGRSLRVNGKIDIGEVNDGAFRIYNYTTFRGGFGTASWAGSGAATSIGIYSSENLYISTNNQSAAKFVFNTSGTLEIKKSSGTIISHDAFSDAIGYNPSYGTYIGGATGRYVYSGLYSHPIFWDGSAAHAIHHNGGQISNTYGGDHTFDSGNTSSGGIVIQGSSTGGPRLGIKSTNTDGKEWWLISNNSGNTDGAGYLQFWNNTDGVTAATWSYAAGTRSNIYTPLKVEAKAQPPVFASTTSGDWRPTLVVDTSGQSAHGLLVNQTITGYWAAAISTQEYGLYIDGHAGNGAVDLLRCDVAGTTYFNVTGGGSVQSRGNLTVGLDGTAYGRLILSQGAGAGGTIDAYAPNGSYIHCDVRNNGNYGKWHKYTNNGSSYGEYEEAWWDGSSYHNIKVSGDAWRFDSPIISASNITAYGSYSDRNLKENIVPVEDTLSLIKDLGVYRFNYKGREDTLIGVIAQEVEQTLPELVYEVKDDEGELRKAVKYEHLAGVLLKAVQQQQDEIDELKALVKTLMEKLQ